METEDLSSDLDKVRKTVNQARTKLLQDWISQNVRKKAKDLDEKSESDASEHKDQLVKLQAMRETLKEKGVLNKKDLSEREKQLELISKQIEALLLETEDLHKQKGTSVAIVEALKKQLQKEQEYLSMQEEATQTKLVGLTKSLDWYHSAMGLAIKKTYGSKLQVIFTNIHREKPSQPYFFSVKIDEAAGTYIISDCDPPVKDLDELSKKLNDTNDFRGFIITMRSRFKQLV